MWDSSTRSHPALILVASLLSSCRTELPSTTSLEPTTATYVGVVHDGDDDFSIGLAARDGRLAIFLCGDDPTRSEYPGWITGEAMADGRIELSRSGWSISGTLGAEGAGGTLSSPEGVVTRWSAAPVSHGTLAGLYATKDSGCTTGVVVIDRGPATTPLVRGAWCDADGHRAQVTPAYPVELVDGRLVVEVVLQTGRRPLQVAPIELPLQ